MFPNNQQVLFTCQKHDAEKAGTHYDYRIVVGDRAYSWATFKDLPEPGKAIILHEQPVHDRGYALSKQVIIPPGQYGAGITNLLYAKKGVVKNEEDSKDKFVIETKGERYLIKHVPSYGPKMWLFKNLGKESMKKEADVKEDLAFAKKALGEEEMAIRDYTSFLKSETNPYLRKVTEHALREEKEHAKGFREAISQLEKSATMVHQYEHLALHGVHRWATEHDGEPDSKMWKPTGKVKYIRRKQNKYLQKVAEIIRDE